MKLKLVKLEEKYRKELTDMMDEWLMVEKKFSPFAIRKNDHHNFKHYLENLENKIDADGMVPESVYFCLDEERNRFVGAICIRHHLADELLFTGGHIGYGVRPTDRRKGIASEMLRQALQICKTMGIDRVLLTCDKDNIGSARTILNNGGVLENEVINEEGILEQRYWIELNLNK